MDANMAMGVRSPALEAEQAFAGSCAHELFEAQAALTPDATAITFEGQSLSYLELDRRANQLASSLRNRGVGPGALVGHYLERGPGMVVGVLGIWKAGGAYVPLNPSEPVHRLQFLLRDSEVGVVLTESRLLRSLPDHRARLVLLDDWETIAGCPQICDGPRAAPSDLAYVIYTSGTTGLPKGVQIPHRAVVNFLRSMRSRPGMSSQDVLLAVTPLSFDIAVLELLLPLTVGARCEILSREVARDGARLAERLTGSGATVMQATPATWLLLLEAGWEGDGSLKVLCGGEAMTRALADRLLPRCGSLWNMYGPTETTVWSTVERVQRSPEPVPIGLPIANTSVYILGPDLKPVPTGQEGELYIGGAGVALGYWKRPGLTAEKFIPDPFNWKRGERLYKTGDLARHRPDGTIEFLGRLDHQVKIRGFRIELSEIDSWLCRHPAVLRAVTLAREDHPGEKRLVSYVVLGEDWRDMGPPATAGWLRRYLAERLPEYMVPAAFVALPAMPLTPNGKVDRDALPAPGDDSVRQETPYVAPQDDLEAELAGAWEEVLGVSPVGIEDDFFQLGGHSLLALQIVARLERTCGTGLPVAALIHAPTVRLLAARVRSARSGSGRSTLVEVQAGGRRPPFFCLPGGTGVVNGLGSLSLRELAALLGPDQPVLTFQCETSDLDSLPAPDIGGLAMLFVRDLRARFPDGPYHLGGYSIGAYVAFEMARLLHEGGHNVGLVALIDMWGVNYPAVLPKLDRWRRKCFADLRERVLAMTRKTLAGLGSSSGAKAQGQDTGARKFEQMVDAYRWSLWTYHYPGRVTLFRASEKIDMPGFCLDDPNNGCLPLAQEVEVLRVPGDHLTLMSEPNVRTLAASLRSLLDAARSTAPHRRCG